MKTIIAKITLGLASRADSGSTMTTIDNYITGCEPGSTVVYQYKENTVDAENQVFDLIATMRINVNDRVAAVDSLKTFVGSPLFAGYVSSFDFSYSE
jgi:hypothetical protein